MVSQFFFSIDCNLFTCLCVHSGLTFESAGFMLFLVYGTQAELSRFKQNARTIGAIES